jgi:putative NADPH-quinone reductase
MNVLIVHAHPEAKSFNSALMALAKEQFTQAGIVSKCLIYMR